MQNAHIVLATDFSDEAARAYAPTLELARALGARVTLAHVIPDLTVIPYGAGLAPMQHEPDLPEKIAEARKRLAALAAQLGNGIPVASEILTGERTEKALTDFAEQNAATFIAMSTHGRSGLRRVMMGSVAEAVLRQSVTPLIVFPRDG